MTDKGGLGISDTVRKTADDGQSSSRD